MVKIERQLVRDAHNNCEMGHAVGGIHWWNNRVDIECHTCTNRPGNSDTSCCDCADGPLDEYPVCDCNGKTLYSRYAQVFEVSNFISATAG